MCCFLGGRTGIVEDEGEALFLGGAAVELPKEATDTATDPMGGPGGPGCDPEGGGPCCC